MKARAQQIPENTRKIKLPKNTKKNKKKQIEKTNQKNTSKKQKQKKQSMVCFFCFFFARLSSNPESKAHFGKPTKKKQQKTWYVFCVFLVFGCLKCVFCVLVLFFFCFFLRDCRQILSPRHISENQKKTKNNNGMFFVLFFVF